VCGCSNRKYPAEIVAEWDAPSAHQQVTLNPEILRIYVEYRKLAISPEEAAILTLADIESRNQHERIRLEK
jgi:hypothetical protein